MLRTRLVILLLALLLPLKESRIAVEANCNAKGNWGQQSTLLGKSEQAGHPTPLMRAASKGDSATVKADTAVVATLLDKGADPNVRDEGGSTPMMYAILKGYAAIVKALLDKRADVNARKPDGRTPLTIAKAGAHSEVVRLLIKAGAKHE